MLFTGVITTNNNIASGVTNKIGCFDTAADKSSGTGNGHYFKFVSNGSGGTMSVCELNADSETAVAQSSWNIDTFNGLGPSELTVTDWSKAYVYFIDLEWLGAGSARFGIVVNNSFNYCHRMNHFGTVTAPYMVTAKLPIRYDLTVSNSVSPEIRAMCASVLSEGGFLPYGPMFSAKTGPSGKAITTSTRTPLVAIRLTSTEPAARKTLLVSSVSLYNANNSNPMSWEIVMLPNSTVLTSASFTSITGSSAQFDLAATAVDLTGGYILRTGFIAQNSEVTFDFSNYNTAPLVTTSIAGTSRVIALCALH